jgi:prolyl oligopeptidase
VTSSTIRSAIFVATALSLAGCPAPQPTSPPPQPTTQSTAGPSAKPKPGPALAKREDTKDVLHGVTVADPYRWLEEVDSDDTKSWLTELGGYSRTKLDALPGRETLAKRLNELSYLESVSSPQRRGNRYFFRRRHKDKEKTVHYWREGKTGEPKVLIDPNTLSTDGSIALKGVWPSWNGKWAAFKLSENNADEATMYLMDVATGKRSKIDEIPGAKYASASWEPKSRGFYYTRLPMDPKIPVKERPGHAEIYFHALGKSFEKDKLVHPKLNDPKVFVDAEISRDGNYLFLSKYYGWARVDVLYKDLRKHKEWQNFAVGMDAKFYPYAWDNAIYVHTNYQAPRYRVFKVDPKNVAMDKWKEIVPQHARAVLDDVRVIGGHLALNYLDNASSRLEIRDLSGKKVRDVKLPGIGTVYGPGGLAEDDTAYYAFASYTSPITIYETSVKKGGAKVYSSVDAPVDPKPYTTEQVWFKSKDGTKVSMFIIRRKDMKLDGSTPFLLHGYGGFNINETPEFSATRFAFLDRGGAFALPNLRGGGEYGEQWHKDGMLLNKQNVFDDFIAAAEFLIAKKYTSSQRLAISGGSNGGLLVGAVMVQRPELFHAVVCGVPLLDMVRYHLFGSGQTWISEYGSADDPEQFKVLYGYSPYHQLKQGTSYPALLMLTADSDDRVDPLHARKFVAAMRWATNNDRNILLRLETKAGHGGGDMVKKLVERRTDTYAFLFDELGMN